MIIFKKAKIDDCKELADNMRQAEIDEVMTSGAQSPYQAVKSSFEASLFAVSAFNGKNGNKIVATFGVAADNYFACAAKVWMLTSNEIANVRVKSVLKASKYWIDKMLKFYPVLYNFVDTRHTKSIKWLEACGARIDFENPVEFNEVDFYYFELKR
jgi:hypothetical protein